MPKHKSELRIVFERDAIPLMGLLYAGAMKLTRNPRDAEDLLQDTYVRAFEKFHLFRAGTNLKAWMFRVMMNRFINLYRRRQAAPDRAMPENFDAAGPAQAVRAADFASAQSMSRLMTEPVFLDSLDDRLKRALEGLGAEYREILILNVIGDMAYKDIAETLSIPIGTVMSRLSRAKGLLRERLVELGREILPDTNGKQAALSKPASQGLE